MDRSFSKLSPAEQDNILEGPALPPPHGIVPVFVDPTKPKIPNLGFGLMITSNVISILCAAIRFYVKRYCIKKLRIEDYLNIISLAILGVYQYFACSIVLFPGAFTHQWDIRLRDLDGILYNYNGAAIVYSFVTMLLKVTIMLDLIHLFTFRTRNTFYWTCYIFLWMNTLYYTVKSIIQISLCVPRQKILNQPFSRGICSSGQYTWITVSGSINVASDIIIFILPLHIVWKLRISTKKKVGISVLFATGAFGCVCAMMRLYYSIKLAHSEDLTYNLTLLGIFVFGEFAAGFIITGLPSLPKAIKSIPVTQKLYVALKSWMSFRLGILKSKTNSRKGLPSWYKPVERQRSTVEGMDDNNLNECARILEETMESRNGPILERDSSIARILPDSPPFDEVSCPEKVTIRHESRMSRG